MNIAASISRPTGLDRAKNKKTSDSPRYLYSRWADFFLLGGSSLLLIPLLFIEPKKENLVLAAVISLVMANVINHPHFAHSYQLFYRRYFAKLRDPELGSVMRARYAVAGLVVPILLIAYFAYGAATSNVRMVGLGGNIMALFVGWHYVKQGYGMLMVDAALKRQFFSAPEKKLLLANSYATWAAAWILINSKYSTTSLWGLNYATFPIPQWMSTVAVAMTATGGVALLALLVRKYRLGQRVPANGLVAYCVTLYLWTLLPRFNPFWLLFIPALHSIQYLAVVYRFQSNVERQKDVNAGPSRLFLKQPMRLVLFATAGFVLGALLFWILPDMAGKNLAYNRDLFGPTLFLFIFWVCVNVHHYFIDSVMWRRENPETKLHLFS